MAVLFTVLLGLGVCIIGYFGYYFSRGYFVYGTEAIINAEIQHFIDHDKQNKLVQTINVQASRPDRIFFLSDQNGRFITGNIATLPEHVSLMAEGTILFDRKDRTYAARIHTFPSGYKFLLGVDITKVQDDYAMMTKLSILSILSMLAVIIISFLISIFVVSRTGRIAQTAKNIMETGNLSQRIEVDSRWDDLSYTASVLNLFLDRVQGLIENVRQVSDNIAHDLRTPLMRLRNDLEGLKKNSNHPEKFEKVIGEADQILTMFSALLRISNIELGQEKFNFETIHVNDIINDVLDLYEPLAEEKSISIQKNISACHVKGDRDLLFQCFANLLDNAIKFTPTSGKILINLHPNAVFELSDTGPGIADQDKDKIFRRFYRAEQSRHMKGNGLGLSMVDAVLRLHGAKIELKNQDPGLLVKITFV